jgi:hypothetical protein
MQVATKGRASLQSLKLQVFLSVLFNRSSKNAFQSEKEAFESWKFGKSVEFHREEIPLLPVQMTSKTGKNSQKRKLTERLARRISEMKQKFSLLGELVGRKMLTEQRAGLYLSFWKWEQLTCGGSWAQLAVLRAALLAKTHRDERYTGFFTWKTAVDRLKSSENAQKSLLFSSTKQLKAFATVLLTHHYKTIRLAQRSALLQFASLMNSPSFSAKQTLIRLQKERLYRVESILVLRNSAKLVALGKALIGKELGNLGTKLRTAWIIWKSNGNFKGIYRHLRGKSEETGFEL